MGHIIWLIYRQYNTEPMTTQVILTQVFDGCEYISPHSISREILLGWCSSQAIFDSYCMDHITWPMLHVCFT